MPPGAVATSTDTGRGSGPTPTAVDLRREFLLDPDVVFLNHGSFGACPRPVFDEYQRWQRELEREPVDFVARRGARLLADARATLAEYVGCRADDIVFVPNATHGVNVVAHSLTVSRRGRLQPGDEVLTTDHEYGACARAWRMACAQVGAVYRPARVGVPVTTPADVVESVWSCVTDRTRVLFLSHITSPTGLVMPVAELCRRARRAGILSVIDGAHGPGQVDLDLRGLDADFYAGNCHKWLCAPKGAGFLYARAEAQWLVEPLVVSWGTRPEAPGPSRYVDDLEFTGTRDLAAYLAVPAAIAYQRDRDWPTIRERCHAVIRGARRRLLELGARPIHPDEPAWYRQMEAVVVPVPDAPALAARLFERHRVEVPAYWWNGLPILRLAVQAYNTEADVEALVAAFARELGHDATRAAALGG